MGMPIPENVAISIQACAAGVADSAAADAAGMLRKTVRTAPVKTADLLGNGFMVSPPYAWGMILRRQLSALFTCHALQIRHAAPDFRRIGFHDDLDRRIASADF
jgi:hypothetical protein